ncbi:MAG: Gfo/Idh/MocA family oxidoreductase [Chloroflexi bacterium]|nr:Gfo/Idh/MocA family oxidoreductase [Chloroflexota bacterium]
MSSATSAEPRVRLGLIGAGGFGAYTAELIDRQPEIDLVGVADVDPAKAKRLGHQRRIPCWTDHRSLLDACDCDAVAVVTPHSTHRDIVVDAAAASRHVFCEKTMAITVADCYDMVEAADTHGVKLMVGHKRRFRPAAVAIRNALRSDGLGRPLAVNVRGYFGRHITGFWREKELCGGLLYWAGVHDIDTLRYLFGEVASVYAVLGPKVRPEISDQEDAISAALTFQSGMLGSIQVSTFFPMATYQTAFGFDIVCERGGIAYCAQDLTVTTHIEGERPYTVQLEHNSADGAYDREWSSFAAWVLRDETPVLTGEDGLRCVEILQAAYLSADTGARVDLPLDRNERRPFNGR